MRPRRDGNRAVPRRLPGVRKTIVFAFIWVIGLSIPATAQNLTLDLGTGGEATGRIVQLVALITILTLAPAILVMVTSFVRIVVVLSLLRTALGTQGTPPNTVVISLSLFMTFFIMQPSFERIYDQGIALLIAESIDEKQAFERSAAPIRDFMMKHVR